MHLYDHAESGNCYKVRLLLTQLGIPFTTESVSVTGDRDAQRGPAFFARNPIGKIPTLVLDDGTALAESTAILWYLAEGTPFLPDDKLERARVLSWMAFEQNNHEPSIATARHQVALADDEDPTPAQIEGWQAAGNRALGVMERWLTDHDWFAAGRYTIADIALYAYTHVADEGPFSLEPYPAVRRWLARVAAQPGHVPIRPAPNR